MTGRKTDEPQPGLRLFLRGNLKLCSIIRILILTFPRNKGKVKKRNEQFLLRNPLQTIHQNALTKENAVAEVGPEVGVRQARGEADARGLSGHASETPVLNGRW